jgi:hypothetical protein
MTEPQVHQAYRDPQVYRDSQVPQEPLDLKVPLEFKDSQVLQVLVAYKDLMVPLA